MQLLRKLRNKQRRGASKVIFIIIIAVVAEKTTIIRSVIFCCWASGGGHLAALHLLAVACAPAAAFEVVWTGRCVAEQILRGAARSDRFRRRLGREER